MKDRVSLLDLIVRYKTHLNIGGLIACGLWAGWIAWMTRPEAIDVPAPSPACCMRSVH
jgi:hypothetical protein